MPRSGAEQQPPGPAARHSRKSTGSWSPSCHIRQCYPVPRRQRPLGSKWPVFQVGSCPPAAAQGTLRGKGSLRFHRQVVQVLATGFLFLSCKDHLPIVTFPSSPPLPSPLLHTHTQPSSSTLSLVDHHRDAALGTIGVLVRNPTKVAPRGVKSIRLLLTPFRYALTHDIGRMESTK